MAKKSESATDELLRDLIIIQLGLAGLPSHTIRKIAGCSMERVTRITKHLNKD